MTATIEQQVEMQRHTASARVRSVLFIIDQLTELGGAERMMFELARKLRAEGVRVSIVTFREKPSEEVWQLSDDITVLPMRSCFSLAACGVALKIFRIIRERRVDIVQTYFESADLFGAFIARISGAKRILSSRRDMGILRTRKHSLLYRLCAPYYDAVLAVSSRVAAWHQTKDAIPKNKMHIIHNGVDLQKYGQKVNLHLEKDLLNLPAVGPLITTIANINPWKGLDVFIEAAALICAQIPDAVFAIAGERTDLAHYASLKRKAEDLGIAGKVFFLGCVDNIPPLLLSSDVFLLLSYSEGFPNVVVEAMAAGLPVIATDVGGTSEAVANGVTGYLVPSGSAAMAASRVVEILSDPALRRRMGYAGRLRAEQNFSLDQMVARHVEVYDALLQ